MLVFILFAWTSVDITSAVWCTKKKEVTTKLDQLQALHDAKLDCLEKISSQSEKHNKEGTCFAIFDGLMCWPSTKAGTILHLPCPEYIHGFSSSGYATKECLSSGVWKLNPALNTSYTNFTGCIGKLPTSNTPTITEIIQDHMTSIQTLYRVGYSVSLVFLIVAVFIMVVCSRLRCQRNTIHINLFVSFILRCIICLVKDRHGIPEGEVNIQDIDIKLFNISNGTWWCKMVHSVLFYSLLLNYIWIFVEGIYLHALIFVTTFHNISRKMFRLLIIVGWVSPAVFVTTWIVVRIIYENTLCWNIHSTDKGYFWIIQGPIIATLTINFGLFLHIIRVLFSKLSAANTRDPKRYRKLARSTLVLIPLFGVHYIVFIAIPICLDPRLELAWMYTELIFSSFQGFIVSMLFCFLNEEVQAEVRKHWKWQRLRRQSLVSSRSTRAFSFQSSGFIRDQSNLADTNANGIMILIKKDLSDSLPKDGLMETTSETELCPSGNRSTSACYNRLNDDDEFTFPSANEKVSFL